MPPIILLAHVAGAGKSTVSKKFSLPSFVVHADTLQQDVVRLTFPFMRNMLGYR
ncbi:hypothetical protein [Rubripirellula reticaptiva]|uniref:Uncharacterized protein n=1 Tax=Rubripirellula reticaptiva TaxID=2528013 RepID=A0A5C6ESV1_9BACT|nr:hypothetical protein [Rubripirellula reticaptiva]TWU51400.1 hypothetical protein Poly59_29920 [Rubripirellula reticaptiva]